MSGLRHALFLATRQLAASPARAAVVVLGLAVAFFLPTFTVRVGALAEGVLLARARATPIVVGHVGDETDLVLAAAYFRGAVRDPVPQALARQLADRGYGLVVPLHLGFTAGGVPVVGTTLDYLDARDLTVVDGRAPAVLGEVVAGAGAARTLGLGVGDALRSDARELYNLAGSYPVLLRVVGVLAPSGMPDDDVLFADLKTTWTLEGLLHGHDALKDPEIVGGDGEVVEASLSIFLHTEITPETLPGFHLHGTADDWPVSAILVFPKDRRAHDEVLGDLATDALHHAVRPERVVRGLLDLVFQLQALLSAWVLLVGAATAAFVGLVVDLVLRLRAPEIRLFRRVGAARGRVALVLGVEGGLLVGAALAVGLVAVPLAEGALLAWLGWGP